MCYFDEIGTIYINCLNLLIMNVDLDVNVDLTLNNLMFNLYLRSNIKREQALIV